MSPVPLTLDEWRVLLAELDNVPTTDLEEVPA